MCEGKREGEGRKEYTIHVKCVWEREERKREGEGRREYTIHVKCACVRGRRRERGRGEEGERIHDTYVHVVQDVCEAQRASDHCR